MPRKDLRGREEKTNIACGMTRSLHAGHFAFMRAVLQGIDPKVSWDRYLSHEREVRDIRAIRQTIQWVRDEFSAAARRYARHGIARLVLIDAEQVQEARDNRPSLDEFVYQNQLHDFSYAEQLEYYEEKYGKATQRQSRRSRLLKKQLEALHWLENIAVQPPKPDDPISAWLNPVLAQHLEHAGITSLRELVDRINGVGRRWASTIPAIGEAKAKRIVDWLRLQESALQLQVGSHVHRAHSTLSPDELREVVAPRTAVVPLEKLVIPESFEGRTGRFRASPECCALKVDTDRDAMLAWLETKKTRKSDGTSIAAHTYRAYFKEAERYFLWTVIVRQRPLSSLNTEDCLAYCRFLADPMPREKWCGPRGREKWSPLWRPFEGPLSVRAQRHAITILKNLHRYLTANGYLSVNSWDAVPLPAEVTPRTNRARRFSDEQWRFITRCLVSLPDTSANRRLQFALPLLRETGMRLSEAVAARVGDLSRAATSGSDAGENSDEGWTLQVNGTGRAGRQIPLSPDLVRQLRDYLASRHLSETLSDADIHDIHNAALLGRSVDVPARAPWSLHARTNVDSRAGVTAGSQYEQIKNFFAACGKIAEQESQPHAAAFSAASTEWLRHTYADRKSLAETTLKTS